MTWAATPRRSREGLLSGSRRGRPGRRAAGDLAGPAGGGGRHRRRGGPADHRPGSPAGRAGGGLVLHRRRHPRRAGHRASGSWPTRPAPCPSALPGDVGRRADPARSTRRSASAGASGRPGQPASARPRTQRPFGARAALGHQSAQRGRVLRRFPLPAQRRRFAGPRPTSGRGRRDLLRDLDRSAVPHVTDHREVPAPRTAPAARAARDGRSPAIAALCRAFAIPSSLITRSQTAALFSAVGISARIWVARRSPGRRRVGRRRRVDLRRARRVRAPPAHPAGSRTGRCRRSARPAAPNRRASRRSRLNCSGCSFAAGERLHGGELGVAARSRPTRARSRSARGHGRPAGLPPPTPGRRRSRPPPAAASQHPLQHADLVLGGHAAHRQGDEIPGPHQRVPGHLPDRRPQQGSRQRFGHLRRCRRSRWPAMPGRAGPCSTSGRRR